MEIRDTLTIYRSSNDCLSDARSDECLIIRLKDGYELLNYNKTNFKDDQICESFTIDTLISEGFYNKVIDFEFLIKTYQYKEVSRYQSRYTEEYNFSLNGVTQSYRINGFLDIDPELERVMF